MPLPKSAQETTISRQKNNLKTNFEIPQRPSKSNNCNALILKIFKISTMKETNKFKEITMSFAIFTTYMVIEKAIYLVFIMFSPHIYHYK